MAVKKELKREAMVKAINNTTGLLSFRGMDDKKYSFPREGSYKMIELSIVESLYNEFESFITKGYLYFEDVNVYEFLGVPEEIYSKIISLKEIPQLLEEDADVLKEKLEEMPDPIKENVAVMAKKSGMDSKKKIKAIKDATGFDVENHEEE